ncbi:MAG: HypC/HybG/HupF family hydrogenase formation chaperone [Clostridia bacterium]|nr:HypC/HybG/HupF family hydrogenase formation chaperone [Clostridia bacterium]MBO7690075.1 HypC/HybG/HupF family hydrogenase formation chaperone [Clostridia bacterium]MBP5271963.1 HypC/HybG/HupF family hydrogenase formation chaperone [Clostridia bacterium]MBP5458968.1 HypC/HybG/HupF family hydrogenase formation chaperone [Clostridia bacterium]
MCVGLPAKVTDLKDGVAVINANGAEREVSAEMIRDLAPGDYVMVHAGMAIAKIDGDDETQAEDIMNELEDLL